MSEPVCQSVYSHRTVLVTGAQGFIGQHTCARLVSAGAIVHTVSRRSVPNLPGTRQSHQVDLGRADDVARLIDSVKPDYVFHLASHVSGSRAIEEVGPTFDSNLASTVHLLRCITGTNCRRIVLAGSLEESTDTAPSSPYAAAKSAASMTR